MSFGWRRRASGARVLADPRAKQGLFRIAVKRLDPRKPEVVQRMLVERARLDIVDGAGPRAGQPAQQAQGPTVLLLGSRRFYGAGWKPAVAQLLPSC
ncbi:hypothetical protein BOSEA31B_14799 [Hyphomicrobiales bacterium]|nr:hypothetical protein BOSEA31B_14799 [Hyphomicrobiales bacterium]CAH1701288.1 hypothetical protein BOSEA1005_20987 [Hyphomicrobiales bacterium]